MSALRVALRLFLAACVALCLIEMARAESGQIYQIDLPAQSVASALRSLSKQTGVAMMFSYDLAKDRTSNPVIGRYTLPQALQIMLADTGLSGGLSEEGVLTISLAKSRTDATGEALVTQTTQSNKKRTSRMTGIAAFFSSLAAAFSASAQDADLQAEMRNGNGLEEIIVTAQKKDERLRDVPIPVTVLGGDVLVQGNHLRLRDYYTQVPSLSMVPNRSSPVVAIRGLITAGEGTGGVGNPTVGVVVDDVPYGSSTGAGGGTWVPDLDPNDLARVEVLRGPQGTLYGASSIGGLLKYVTVEPATDAFSGRVQMGMSQVSHGDDPGYNVRGSVNIPVSDAFALRVSGFTRQDPGYITDVRHSEKGINEGNASGGRLAALWRLSDAVKLNFSALTQDDEVDAGSYSQIAPGLGTLEIDRQPDAGATHKRFQIYTGSLQATLSRFELTALSGYNTGKFDFKDSNAIGQLSVGRYTTDKFTQEVRIATSLGEKVDWRLGGFYTDEDSQIDLQPRLADPTTGATTSVTYDLQTPTTFKETAAFTDLTFKFTDRFDVQIGARQSWIKQTYQNDVTPVPNSAGLNPVEHVSISSDAFTYLLTPRFRLSTDLMLYARVASGYRAGGVNNNFTTPGVPPAYDPDKTRNYEVGIKGNFFDDRLSLDASVYHIDWQDLQLRVFVDPLLYTTNAGEAKSDGVDLSMDFRPVSGLRMSGWIALNQAELTKDLPVGPGLAFGESGTRLPYSSRVSGRLSVDKEFPLRDRMTGFVGIAGNYIGERKGNFQSSALVPRQIFPSYFRADLRGGIKYDTWSFDLFVNNVTDKRGVDSGNPSVVPSRVTYIQPRTTGISASKSF